MFFSRTYQQSLQLQHIFKSSMSSISSISKTPGASSVFIIRHGERLDNVNLQWSKQALRPQDTPLSIEGHNQARRLGKWLYSKLPISKPIKIFCSPYIRCVQTANGIAEQLEGLEYSEAFGSSKISSLCIEPGISEDPYYFSNLKCNTPYFLNAADLMSISHRIDLSYQPIRHVQIEKKGDSYVETNSSGTDERLNNIIHEITKHASIQNDGTAIIVTHAKPSVDMMKSLNPVIDNIPLPHYEDIKQGHYRGPPIQYTACTHMVLRNNVWRLKKGSKLFSNEHDPRLKHARAQKNKRNIKYVFEENLYKTRNSYFDNPSHYTLREYEIGNELLKGKKSNELCCIQVGGNNISFRMPSNYNKGDVVIVRGLF